jgi:hypothetical protein
MTTADRCSYHALLRCGHYGIAGGGNEGLYITDIQAILTRYSIAVFIRSGLEPSP